MEDLFEFLFGSGGRVNRAKYRRSVVLFSIAGLLAAVILFTAAGIAAPLFVIMVVIVFIPWLPWGISFTTERLHDRDKSAWWLVMFYLVPGVLCQSTRATWFTEATGARCNTCWRWQVLCSRSEDSSKPAACAALPGRTHMGPTRSLEPNDRAERQLPKRKKARRP